MNKQESKEDKKQRILRAMKFFFSSRAQTPDPNVSFHDPAMYTGRWESYRNVMKRLLQKNPVYLYVSDVQNAKSIEELSAFETDHARYYYNSEHEQKLLKNGTYNYIEGIIAYSFHQQTRYGNKQIMVFGEEHTPMRCTSSLQMFGAKPIPYVHVLHHILTTQASAKHPIDVFVERQINDVTKQQQQGKRMPIDDVLLYYKTHFQYPLRQIDALYGRNVLPHVRFHWVDLRRTFPFLNQMMTAARTFLSPRNPNEAKDADIFDNIVKTYIQPLSNPNGLFLEALFAQVGIRKQLDKTKHAKLSQTIETYFKNLITSLATELVQMKPAKLWKKLIAEKGNVEKQRKMVSEIYEGEDLLAFEREMLKGATPIRLFRSTMVNYISRINAYFMDAYTMARVFKPYVGRAILHVGDMHADVYRNFLNSLQNMEMLDDFYSDTGCMYVPFPIKFLE